MQKESEGDLVKGQFIEILQTKWIAFPTDCFSSTWKVGIYPEKLEIKISLCNLILNLM